MHETLRSTIGRRLLARRTCERGVALVSTLTVVVILGIIVTVVVARGPSGPTTTGVGGSGGTTTTTSVKTIGNDATASAVSACLASYSDVATALTYYKTLNGTPPPAGTAWATSATSGSALLESWPAGAPYYRITWNGTELSVIPERGAPSRGTSGASSPRSGCYAA